MSAKKFDDHVLARPVRHLPEYAKAPARTKLRETLIGSFGLSTEAAITIANTVVDPAEVRKKIGGDATDPQCERIPVPGGTLFAIRTQVWSRRIIPDARNPRTGPARRHPFAVDPGTGGEDAKFRPLPDPGTPTGKPITTPELEVAIENRHHLEWASGQAATFVLAENDWRSSIASQGVMEAVWLAVITYAPCDGTASATALTTVEGSSRTTAVHNLNQVRSADVPYTIDDAKLRAVHRDLNDKLDKGTANADELVTLRTEHMPGLILVGFDPHPGSATGFATAVKSLVALRHVDPPKPWGDGPENEALADEVLNELYRCCLINETKKLWLAGASTKGEAKAAHLSDDPVQRATAIVSLLTSEDDDINQAIRVAVTSQSTRKRIFPKLRNDLATALILRGIAEDSARIDQYRRYLRHGFGKAVHRETWEATDKDIEVLAAAAKKEVTAYFGNANATEPGPASLELAVRAAVPLITTGRLNADRGTAGNKQPDRRTPGEILDAMRRTHQGISQLRQALKDYAADTIIRMVDENGAVRMQQDGSTAVVANDILLRDEYPANGVKPARSGGNTPEEVLEAKLAAFGKAVDELASAHKSIAEVLGDDGNTLIDTSGANPHTCKDWRKALAPIEDDLVVWGRVFSKRYGTNTLPNPTDDDLPTHLDGEDEGDDAYDGSYESWDSEAEALT